MVSRVGDSTGCWRFVLRPNCSASWTQIKFFFLGISCVRLTIAAAFATMGYWPVLPFAGAELLALWLCLRYSSRWSQAREIIEIDDQTVAVARGRRRPEHRWSFPRAWARIRFEPALVRMHPSRLLIGSHGRSVRLGAFLTEDEREQLARELRTALRAG